MHNYKIINNKHNGHNGTLNHCNLSSVKIHSFKLSCFRLQTKLFMSKYF